MVKSFKQKHEFYGTTTIGEKGQVVIPSDARKAMKLGRSEKLLVFGMGKDMLMLAKISNLEKFAAQLTDKLESIQKIIKKHK